MQAPAIRRADTKGLPEVVLSLCDDLAAGLRAYVEAPPTEAHKANQAVQEIGARLDERVEELLLLPIKSMADLESATRAILRAAELESPAEETSLALRGLRKIVGVFDRGAS